MKKLPLLLLTLLLALSPCSLTAQTAETDSIDVLHYDLAIDLSDTTSHMLRGVADITFVLTRDCSSVTFELICDQVSPVSLDGTVTRGFSYNPDDGLLSVYLSGGQVGDTHVLSVPYTTNGYIESSGWGGLHLDPYIYYNLGAAFSAYPHAFGRSWFPCRDNFYDKATYRFTVTSKPGWSAICSGLLQSVDTHPDGTTTHVYLLDHPPLHCLHLLSRLEHYTTPIPQPLRHLSRHHRLSQSRQQPGGCRFRHTRHRHPIL